ncbi:MAG: hypothetical protein K8L97_01790 [Anaerolineae bacterium]|nr:hypothetical protein [Anaerolineae bacterium]
MRLFAGVAAMAAAMAMAKKGLAAKKPLAFSHQPLVNIAAFASLLCRKCRANDNG